MTRKICIALLSIIVIFTSRLQAQQKNSLKDSPLKTVGRETLQKPSLKDAGRKLPEKDSVLLKAKRLSLNLDTVAVPVMPENPLLYNQNFVYRLRLDSIEQTVPLTYNEYVQHYIDIYAKRKDMIGKMLGLSKYYFPIFERALKELNIPAEFKYLPIIESTMNPNAVSRVGATGLWQFMFSTGKAYGLDIDNFVDERKDPVRASYAAAAYFRDAYAELGDWLLALASYNCGKGNVTRAIEKAGSRNFWEIRPFLPLETRNYVPAFIAAVYVMNYPGKHGIETLKAAMMPKTEVVQVNNTVSLPALAAALQVDEQVLTDLNPAWKKKVVNASPESPKNIIMPRLEKADFAGIYEVLYPNTAGRDLQILNVRNEGGSMLKKAGTAGKTEPVLVYHKIKAGQSLHSIAQKYGVEVQDLKVWNKLQGTRIVPGQTLKVYTEI